MYVHINICILVYTIYSSLSRRWAKPTFCSALAPLLQPSAVATFAHHLIWNVTCHSSVKVSSWRPYFVLWDKKCLSIRAYVESRQLVWWEKLLWLTGQPTDGHFISRNNKKCVGTSIGHWIFFLIFFAIAFFH